MGSLEYKAKCRAWCNRQFNYWIGLLGILDERTGWELDLEYDDHGLVNSVDLGPEWYLGGQRRLRVTAAGYGVCAVRDHEGHGFDAPSTFADWLERHDHEYVGRSEGGSESRAIDPSNADQEVSAPSQSIDPVAYEVRCRSWCEREFDYWVGLWRLLHQRADWGVYIQGEEDEQQWSLGYPERIGATAHGSGIEFRASSDTWLCESLDDAASWLDEEGPQLGA